MNKRTSSLQAALTGAATEEKPAKASLKKKSGQGRAARKPVTREPVVETATEEEKETNKAKVKPSRENTVMVGGHYPKRVLRQLKMIAVEEDTTNQALIAEALDLLFTRKGKDKISDLTVG